MKKLLCRLEIFWHGLRVEKIDGGYVVYQPRRFRFIGGHGATIEEALQDLKATYG